MGKINATKNILLLFIGILIFIFLIAFKFDLSKLASTISDKISWGFYIFISLLIILQLVCRSTRFKLLFNHVYEDKISFKKSFFLTGASFFVAMATPNKLGDASRGFFFREKGVEVTAITLIEYLFDTLVITAIAFLGVVIIYREYLSKLVLLAVIAIAGLAILFYLVKCDKIKELINRFNWYQKIKAKIELLKLYVKTGVKSKFVLSTAFVFSCSFMAIYCLIFYMVLCRLGSDVSMITILFSTGAGMFIGCLTFIPMGMGTRDLSTYGLLCSVGVDPEIAISSVIIMRSLTISLILVCGFCYFVAVNPFSKDSTKKQGIKKG